MTDRAQLLAEVFARLRWCVGGEFSVSLSPEMCGVLLEALDGPSVAELGGWLAGLEETFASPNRECGSEDISPDGTREGNTCIGSDPGDLEFPDDWCERCYVLACVRGAMGLTTGTPA